MVDAQAALTAPRTGTTRARALPESRAGEVSVNVASGPPALEAYRALSRNAVFAPPQNPHWVECWTREVNGDCAIATIVVDGRAAFALALEIVPFGPLTIARFMGGSHANGNFAMTVPGTATPAPQSLKSALVAAFRHARPDIDMLCLERQVPGLHGAANPLAVLSTGPSPNPALAVDLSGGFEAVLGQRNASRKHKKHRSQTRKFEAAGGCALVRPGSRDESDRLLRAFFDMKSTRFADKGIDNVFADAKVQAFFFDLFGRCAGQDRPQFLLRGLEIGGKLRAVNGCSRTADSLVCEFGTFRIDELASASPGSFLDFECIQAACAEGLSIYDFSVGDEPYKRQWCDIETHHFDIMLGLSVAGRTAAGLMRANAAAKRRIKASPALWSLVKQLRKLRGA
ncbi:GNAT family N-acetyltransferase [Mesorhizobium xinjiangense]|uniref:GNAT family N-acetyltransferase n=1 Tax=Mesorhizobium xinjiangense TaxID=2678685 RepID=UPI0012ED2E5C|nr:GNAT family N-acetyltransferase [Mesorhizobium xinjiangense]